MAIAEQRPQDIHAQCLGDKMLQALVHGYADKVWGCLRFPDIVFFPLRLRAAVFVNAVAIRQAVSLQHGIVLPSESLQKLQTANYLFHSALNSY